MSVSLGSNDEASERKGRGKKERERKEGEGERKERKGRNRGGRERGEGERRRREEKGGREGKKIGDVCIINKEKNKSTSLKQNRTHTTNLRVKKLMICYLSSY